MYLKKKEKKDDSWINTMMKIYNYICIYVFKIVD